MPFRLCEPCSSLYLPGSSSRSVCPHCSSHLRRLSRDEVHDLRNLLLADQARLPGSVPLSREEQLPVNEQCQALRDQGQQLRSHSLSLRAHCDDLCDQSRRLRRGVP